MVRVSRNEGVTLRPFVGLEKLEDYLDNDLKLVFSSNAGTKELTSLAKGLVPPKYISTLGLALRLPSSEAGNIQKLVKGIVGDENLASWAIRVSDRSSGVLRESEILTQGLVSELKSELSVNAIGEVNPCSILQNQFTGFKIEFVLFLNTDTKSDSVSPSRKGTILSAATFEIIPVTDFDAIQPLELTDAVRESYFLPRQAWFFVAFEGDLLETEAFEDSLSFYVEPSVLSSIKKLPDQFKVVGEAVLAATLISQIVFEVSDQLQQQEADWAWDGVTGVMLRFLFASYGDISSTSEFTDLLKDNPSKVSTVLASRANLGARLAETFDKIAEGAMDVSNDHQ